MDMVEIDMVEVQALDVRLEILIVLHTAIGPFHAADGIGLGAQVDECLAGCQRAEMGTDAHGVARHVQRHVGTQDGSLVDMNLPQILRLGRILRDGVVQLDVKVGIFQTGTIGLNGLLVQIDTLARHEKAAEVSFHPCGLDQSGGIQACVGDLQLVDDHDLREERHKLDIDHQVVHIGYGVCLLAHQEMVDRQVERKSQTHLTDRNLHTRLLGSHLGNFINSPILYGRQIKQNRQYDKQENGT